MSEITRAPAWQALVAHQKEMAGVHMRDLFARDPERFSKFSLRLGDLLFDYSKNRITAETMHLLLDLAREANLEDRIAAMFRGDKVNTTDAVSLLLYLFPWWGSGHGYTPECFDACDSDDNGELEITDAIVVLNWLFLSGEAPEPPGPFIPGEDPTEDALDCWLLSCP